jgi:hypothetical protein
LYTPAATKILSTALSLAATWSCSAVVTYLEPGANGGRGGDGGGCGGSGGWDGGGGGEGGDSGGKGDKGGWGVAGGWNCTTKVSVPTFSPFHFNEKLCPKPGAAHSAPFQPSPYGSIMLSVQFALSVTANGKPEAYGAEPLSVVPSEQLRLQLTSSGYEPG